MTCPHCHGDISVTDLVEFNEDGRPESFTMDTEALFEGAFGICFICYGFICFHDGQWIVLDEADLERASLRRLKAMRRLAVLAKERVRKQKIKDRHERN